MRTTQILLTLLISSVAPFALADDQVAELTASDLSRQGFALVVQYCGKCHGSGASEGGGEMVVTEPQSLIDIGYLDPDDPDGSYFWQRIVADEMPPEGEPRPSVAEGDVIRQWIAAGAPKPPRERRAVVRIEDVLTSIVSDMQSATETERRNFVYFTLHHLYNHPDVSDFDLRLYRAALAKAINSLSWSPEIVVPKAVDELGLLLRIDLRDLAWEADEWSAVLAQYPYGLTYDAVRDQQLAETARRLTTLAGGRQDGGLVAIRADWFVVTATRPPLYHRLLEIPATAAELESRLGVNAENNFLRGRVARAGFAESGVSTANRLVERHASLVGRGAYYWKSYDFREDRVKSNLFQKPLGPAFTGNPHDAFAFEHDGGELIFSLPNGLQGYMLIDASGNRIDAGPVEIVQDSKRTSGSPVVVNGISCMHCHRGGMISFVDTVRDGVALFGDARRKVFEVFPERDTMGTLLDRDAATFVSALEVAIGPFLKVAEDADRDIGQFAEPIGAVSQYYHRNVGLVEAACELGIDDSETLRTAIRHNGELVKLGIAPLEAGRTVDRAFWSSRQAVVAPLQETARLIDFGTPFIHFDTANP
jgi:serine/threonine-protein kinase